MSWPDGPLSHGCTLCDDVGMDYVPINTISNIVTAVCAVIITIKVL